MARPTPVLPEVGSTRVVVLGSMRPLASASSIMFRPIRSFTLQQGSMLSSFAAILAPQPSDTLFRYTSGVDPMSSITLPLTLVRWAKSPGREASAWHDTPE